MAVFILETLKPSRRIYSSVQCYVHRGYRLTSIFRHAQQTRRIEIHQSQPTCMTYLNKSDMKQTPVCVLCDWFISNNTSKDDVERWMSKDSRYALNTERCYNVSVVWNKNGMHKSETKPKHGCYSKKRLKTTESLRSL